MRRVLLVVTLLLSALAVAGPAHAHQADPRIVTVLEDVALPAGVVVQAQAGIASQLVAANPTDTPLEVLARGGEPFLRLSRRGVFANLESPDFYETSNPNGSGAGAPARVRGHRGRAAPRFVQISGSDAWGWYDHRLHPAEAKAPADTSRVARLVDFDVPMRYGAQALRIRGHVDFRPLLGSFQVTADNGPADLPGVRADVLQGRLPGLLVTNPQRVAFTVLGVDGEPFVRSVNGRWEVNRASRTYVEDQAARGAPVEPSGPTPSYVPVAAASFSWLDSRLRYRSDAPPEDALRRDAPSTVSRWEIPVRLADGRTTALRGEVRWVPTAAQAEQVQGARSDVRSRPVGVVIGIAAAVVLLAVGLVAVRRRNRAA